MEILHILKIIYNGNYALSYDDKNFLNNCLTTGKIIDLDKVSSILANYFIFAEGKYFDNKNRDYSFDMFSDLARTFLMYLSLKECMDEDYNIYFLNIKAGAQNAFEDYLKKILTNYLNDNSPLSYTLEVKNQELFDEILNMEDNLMEKPLKPFYGDDNYLKHRIIYTTSKIFDIINDDTISQSIRNKFTGFYNILSEFILDISNLKLEGNYEHQKKVYSILVSYYKSLMEIEENLSLSVEEIWNERLLSDRFCGLAHGFTDGEFEPLDAKKVCMCYFDERYITILGNYGYLYPMYMDKCDMISANDEYSYWVTKGEFVQNIKKWPSKFEHIGKGLNNVNRAIHFSGNDQTMMYQDPNYTRLLTPDLVLRENYQKAYKRKLINNDDMPFGIGYNEIVFIDEDKKLMPIGVWFKKDVNHKNWKTIYLDACDLAKRTGLPLMVIDTEKLKSLHKMRKIKTKI